MRTDIFMTMFHNAQNMPDLSKIFPGCNKISIHKPANSFKFVTESLHVCIAKTGAVAAYRKHFSSRSLSAHLSASVSRPACSWRAPAGSTPLALS